MAKHHGFKFLLSSRRDINGQQVLLAWPQWAVVRALSSKLPASVVERHILSRLVEEAQRDNAHHNKEHERRQAGTLALHDLLASMALGGLYNDDDWDDDLYGRNYDSDYSYDGSY